MQREIEALSPDHGSLVRGGTHLLGEWHDCRGPRPLLETTAQLRALCLAAATDAGVDIVGDLFHARPGGIAGSVLCAESHVTIHTWPDSDAVLVDVFVGERDGADHRLQARELYETLRDRFAPEHESFMQVRCGVPA